MEWELDVPTGNAPVASVLQTEWFTCSIGHEIGQVRGTRTHPAGFTGLNAAGYIITWYCLRQYNGSSGRSRTGMVFFTKEVHFWLCHGGMKLMLPRGLAPRTFAFARRHAGLLHLGSFKTTSCRCRPGPCGLEDRHARCYINDVKLVAVFGIAPNSPRLQRGANLSQLFRLWESGPSTR